MERTYFGYKLLPVHCFRVGDTLVDTGLSCLGDGLAAFARDTGVRRALLTHHHEDHAGNAGRLVAAGVQVFGTAATARIVGRGFPIHFYQHVLWGAASPAAVVPFAAGAPVRLGPYEAAVVEAPGHCTDQVALHVPAEGWLFSGDAFIHENIRIFRADEDFAATVATLERFLTLDFDVLYCAHRPRTKNGRAAIGRKLQWLRDIEGRARQLADRGATPREIARRLELGSRAFFAKISFGDVSSENMIRSILVGPTPRPAGAAP